MKKLCQLSLWAVGMLLAARGCVMPVEIAMPEERSVFVKCVLDAGRDRQRATVFYSGVSNDTLFEPVANAEISVSDARRTFHFHYLGEGIYETEFVPERGETYALKVAVPGRNVMEASTTVPKLFTVNSTIVPPGSWFEDASYSLAELNPWAYTPWSEAYELMTSKGGRSLLSEMPGILYSMNSLEHHRLYILARVEDSTGVVSAIHRLATNHMLVDNVNSINDRYHANEPVSPISSQRSRYEYEIQQSYEGLVMHEWYLRVDFPVNYDNGLRNIYQNILSPGFKLAPDLKEAEIDCKQYFAVIGDFEYNIWGTNDPGMAHPVLYFCSVSEEYDRYLRSVQTAIAAAEGDILSTLYGEAAGYSNIRGGYGVFGAISTLRHDCDLKKTFTFGGPKDGYYAGYKAYPSDLPEL